MTKSKLFVLKATFLCTVLILPLLLFEAALRIRAGNLWDTKNTVFRPNIYIWNRIFAGYPEEYHPTLGWIPKENSSVSTPWGGTVHTYSHGIRSNGTAHASIYPVLAVGGSYTFGDQVKDTETWSAHLERILHKPVANGGVSGYALDQIVLRLEQLLPLVTSETTILSVTSENIRWTSLSRNWGMAKPFYTMKNGEIELRNVPCQKPEELQPKLGPVRATLGYSYLLSRLMYLAFPEYWTNGLNFITNSAEEHQDSDRVSCHLMKRAKQLAVEHKSKLVILIQPSAQIDELERKAIAKFATCLDHLKLTYVDLTNELADLKKTNPTAYAQFQSWHFTPAGNELVATRLSEKL